MKKTYGISIVLLMLGVLIILWKLKFFAIRVVSIVALMIIISWVMFIVFEEIFFKTIESIKKRDNANCVIEVYSVYDSIDENIEIVDVKKYEEV